MNYELQYLCCCFSTVPFKAPTNLTGMATNSTSVFVKWDPVYLPTIRGILRGYTVHYKEDSSSVHPSILRNVSVDISVTNVQLVNLHKYTYYLIWVTAFTTRQGHKAAPYLYRRTRTVSPNNFSLRLYPLRRTKCRSTENLSLSSVIYINIITPPPSHTHTRPHTKKSKKRMKEVRWPEFT